MAGICNMLCLVILAVFTIVTAEDYCNMKSCREDHSHTMCQYTSSEPAQKCNEPYHIGLTDDEIDDMVNAHNKLRKKVASGQETRGDPGPQFPADKMPDLSWDTELAKIAQRWANQCDFNHDKCRNVESYVVGQNIAITYSSDENNTPMENFVQMWYDEVDKFDKDNIDNYKFDSNTGHYTQLVWANTTKIGCGVINYKDSDGWNAEFLVCNYGPSGNWENQKVYIKKN